MDDDSAQMPPPAAPGRLSESGIPKPNLQAKPSRIARPSLMRPPSASSSVGDSDWLNYPGSSAASERGLASPPPPLHPINGEPARSSRPGGSRRYSEDLINKRKLTTAHENVLSEMYDYERRLSDASEARRFSEAGISRRTSHASVVLTEDTDRFMVGQRVYVGGTKPGRIVFIGDVKFAPGEFAGVVLDEPVGKNDGTVGGYAYFQCAKNHGVFSRLTRLTFEPLSTAQLAERAAESVAKASVSDVGLGSPLRQASPSPSDRSMSQLGDLKLGDRVMVSSTTAGTKVGTLRYLGTTEFQPGDWAGIELDEPTGKNDGSVAGTRYFECRPKHGLFAPAAKVVRCPYQRRPSNPAGSRSGARRGSQDSLSSLSTTSSAKGYGTGTGIGIQRRSITGRTGVPPSAASAFQEAIKEKEVHIEQLLKEKDLERADLARAVARAEEINQNYIQAVARLEQSERSIAQAQKQVEALRRDLEDEKRKNEDLEFRLEEQSLIMEEYKSQAEGGSKNASPKHGPAQQAMEEENVELLRQKDMEIFELQEANMNKETEVANLAAKIEELEERLRSAPIPEDISSVPDARFEEIEEEIELLRKALRDKDGLIDSLNAQVLDLQTSVGSYQQQLMLQSDEPHIDEADYKAVLNENEALKGENTTKSRRMDELLARIQELELNANAESADMGQMDALLGENEALKSTLKEKEGLLETLKAQVLQLEDDFGKYQQELKDRVIESDQDRAAMEQLKNDLEATQRRLNEVEQKLKESEDERVDLANALQETQTSFSSLEDSRNREEAKRKLLESNLEVLKDELAKSRSSYMDAQRDLENLRSDKQKSLGEGEVNARVLEAVHDKDDAERRVEFLNSVIVDMQRKNEVLQTRLGAIMSDPGSLADVLLPDSGFRSRRDGLPRTGNILNPQHTP